MELQQLKYFKAVAENGKIADTAYSLFISPPALSTSIQRLEKDIGCKLFDRTKNKITLNKQGEIFLKHVNRIFDEVDQAKWEIEESLRLQKSSISLVGINALMWTGLMADFSAVHPDIAVSFTMIPISALPQHGLTPPHTFLLATDSDVSDTMRDSLDSIFLLENRPMVMVSPQHPLAKENEIDITMLKGENILMTAPDHTMYKQIKKMLSECGIPVPASSLDSNQMRQHLVAKNMGISFTSEHAAHYLPATLRFIPLKGAAPWTTRLYWNKDHVMNQSEELFKRFTEQYFCNLPD